MSNIIFCFGATTILSLILILSSATTTTSYYHYLDTPAIVFAQEEEDKEDKEEEEEQEGGEDKDSKDEEDEDKEDKEEDSKDEDKEEEGEGEQNETTTESQITQNELNELIAMNSQQPQQQLPPQPTAAAEKPIMNLTGDHVLNYSSSPPQQPVVNTPIEESGIVLEPPVVNGKPFNATCNCFTTTNIPAPTPPPIPNPPPTPAPIELIPVTTSNIKNSQSLGQVIDPAYTGYYTIANLLDNTIDEYSFWSQAGPSSFYIQLDNILDNYQVCAAELTVNKPNNTPYLLDIGVSKNYSGVIDQTTEQIQFDKCVKNLDEILMTFDSPQNSYISVAEMKLFGKKITDTPPSPPTPTPPPTPPQPAPYHNNNATKINIENSTAEIDIKNSTVTFKFDPQSAQATNYNVITIPNTEVVN